MPTANEALRDRIIRHQHYIERYKAGTVARLVNLLTKSEDDIVAQIAKRDPTGVSPRYTDARLRKLLEEVRALNAQAVAAFRDGTYSEIRSLSTYEAGFAATTLTDSIPVKWNIVEPGAATVQAAVFSRPFQGRLLKEWFSELEPRTFARLRDGIRMGVVQGETVDQIIRRVRGTRALGYKDGIIEATRRGGEALVRTAVQHTVSTAREYTYKDNADLIKGWQYVATLDSRTSLICASLDGQKFPIGEGPQPPQHINCRSSTVPVMKSWKELGLNLNEAPAGTRASMNGQVPEKTTYGEWLRSQPTSVQDEALGTTRAQLFRKGGLKIDQFTNSRGDIYTLDELKQREAGAFARAA